MRGTVLPGTVLALTACSPAASGESARNEAVHAQSKAEAPAAGRSELVAVEFTGSARSLDRLAAEVVRLGWRIETHNARGLRILPPADYDPSRFGLLLERIERLGITDIGLRLIGPNGPVGPEG
jgi:hypothetical protein